MSMVLLPVPLDGEIGFLEILGEMPGLDRAAEGPGEASSPQGEVEACCVGMEPGPSASRSP
jgi:hypothetical protein